MNHKIHPYMRIWVMGILKLTNLFTLQLDETETLVLSAMLIPSAVHLRATLLSLFRPFAVVSLFFHPLNGGVVDWWMSAGCVFTMNASGGSSSHC